jgi:hypothetical protein
MKKVALSLIALLAVGSFAFGEDVAVEKNAAVTAALSLSAKAKFGTDLDHGTTGFSNSDDFNLSLTIIPEADSNKAGSGDIYGTITIENVKIYTDLEDGGNGDSNLDNATDASNNGDALLSFGDVTAKIVFPNGYVQIYKNVDPSLNYAVDGDDDNGGASIVADDAFYTYTSTAGATLYGGDDTEWTLGTLPGASAFAGTGIEVGYTLPSLVSFTVDYASNGDWTTNRNNYEGSIEASLLAVEKLTLAAMFYAGTTTHDEVVDLTDKAGAIDTKAAGKSLLVDGVGFNLAYDLGVAVPFVDFNYILSSKILGSEMGAWYVAAGGNLTDVILSGSYMEADFGSKLPLVDGFNAVVAATYTDKGNGAATTEASKTFDFDLYPNVGAVATLNLASGKLAGPLGALAGVRLMNLLSSTKEDTSKTTEIFAKVTFDLGNGLGVWAKGSTNSSAAKKSTSTFVKAGIDAVDIFPLVTLGAEYDSNDMGSAKTNGDSTLGQVYAYAKVTY